MGNVEISLKRFLLIYGLLIIVLLILKLFKIEKTKLVVISSARMSIQLIIAGLVIQYIFQVQNPIYTFLYLFVMVGFTILRIISKFKRLNNGFKIIIALSVSISGILILSYFVIVVLNRSIFNAQYVIPISGMLLGNTMTAVILGLNSFEELLDGQKDKINALLSIGASAENILLPFVKKAFETSILPTLNSMIGMGIVFLPGMMTGQILAGIFPVDAILYQISVMIAICTFVVLTCFSVLYFGHKTLFDKENQIIKLDFQSEYL